MDVDDLVLTDDSVEPSGDETLGDEPSPRDTGVIAALRRPVVRVCLLAVGLIIGSTLLVAFGDSDPHLDGGTIWMAALVAVGYALAERFVFHVEYRREAVSFSMSEVPSALALVFLGPIPAILIRVVVCVVVIRLAWKSPPFKLFFNAALFAFELALAYTIVGAVNGANETDQVRLLLAVGIALTVSTLVGTVLVTLAIACFEGEVFSLIVAEVRTAVVVSPLVTMIACVSVAPTLFRTELVALAALPVVTGWFVVERHGRLAQSYRDLRSLHGFSRAVSQSLQIDEIAESAVAESMRLMRASGGMIQIWDEAGNVIVEHGDIGHAPSSRRDPAWAAVFDSDRATPFSIESDGSVSVDPKRAHGSIAVLLSDGDGEIGLLLLTGRGGASETFGTAELSQARTLGDQAAASFRRALLHAEMEYAALHDRLTGEYNRGAFEKVVTDRLAELGARRAAVLMFDLNRFKEVNDTLGHHVGDRVLIQFADRLRKRLEPGDVLGRFGGDEFAMLVRRADDDAVKRCAEQILSDSLVAMKLDDLDVVVTTSVGVAFVDAIDDPVAEVMRRADLAMFTAKRERTAVEIYREEIDRRTPARLSLLGSLRKSLEAEELTVHFQPKVDLVTSTVIGAEALARWQHPVHGWVSPADFIQLAEESGLIKQLTDQILTSSVRTLSGWHAAGHLLSVAVNLSTHDLLDEGLPKRIANLLERYEVEARFLTLEITESALLADTPRTKGTIERLDQLGVRMSLDDFGTGYSSLGYLRRLPVAELKVDQSFVKNLLLDEQDAVIVKSTIDLGHNLGLQVVAEGIENMPILTRLQELGCDIAQGYGISRPLAPEQFGTWLATTDYAVAGSSSSSLWA
jgi:diguanylate cyclase (GGDEF)-like protein